MLALQKIARSFCSILKRRNPFKKCRCTLVLILSILLFSKISLAKPAPEAPYPDVEEPGFEKQSTSSSSSKNSNRSPVKPKRILDDGTYIYEPLSPESASKDYGQIDADSGAKIYEPIFDDEQRYGAIGVKLGAFGPFDLQNEKNGISYRDVYGNNPGPLAILDYQFNLFRGFGILALKIGTGLFISPTGSGRFSDSTRADFEKKRNEKFNMLIFPNILTAVYKFQYSDSQFFVPYAEGGAGYFGFAEIRDDGIAPKFGGAAVTVAGGGFQLLIDKLDFNSYVAMKRDYGVDHLWFVADFKAILGLNRQFDFTSQIINAGFLVEF